MSKPHRCLCCGMGMSGLFFLSCTHSQLGAESVGSSQELSEGSPARPVAKSREAMAATPVAQPMASREVWQARIRDLDPKGDIRVIVAQLRERWPPPPHFDGAGYWGGSEYSSDDEVRFCNGLDGDWGLVARMRRPRPDEWERGTAGIVKEWTIAGLEDLWPQIGDDLFEAVRAIHHISRLGSSSDPVSLYRAANRLRSMGKERAIEALRAYWRQCQAHDRGGLFGFDDQRIKDLADLMFVARDARVPLPMTRVPWMWLPRKDSETWPRFPFSVYAGLPFRVPTSGIPVYTGKNPASAGWLIECCAEDSDLRTDPFVPEMDPIGAAEGFLSFGAWDEIESIWPQEHGPWAGLPDPRLSWPENVREQAARALDNVVPYSELVPPRESPLRARSFEERWNRYRRMVDARRPRWDPRIEDFVGTRNVPAVGPSEAMSPEEHSMRVAGGGESQRE